MSRKREELLWELKEESSKSTLDGLRFFQAVAERSGMNLTDLQCVAILASTGPITAGQLAETMGLTTGAVTGVINRMERAGYVQRDKDPGDGRRVVVRPVMEELERSGVGFFGSREGALVEALLSEYDDHELALILDFMRKANAATSEGIARIRAASEGGVGDLSSPLGAVESGRLVFANGAYRLALRADSGINDLYRARFEGPAPKVKVEHGTVTFRYPKRFLGPLGWRSHPGEVTLNAAVPWEVEVRGGAARIKADLEGLALDSLALKGGISDLELNLGEPSGVVPVRLSGGASKVSIRRPSGVEARLSVKGSVGKLTFDEQSFDAVAGKIRLQSPGFDAASNRYEIEVSGGASEITLTPP